MAVRRSRSESRERPIVVASNRLPFTFQRGPRGLERKPSPGGLVSALDPVLRRRGGTWIGWPGLELRPDEEVPTKGRNYKMRAVRLSDAEVQRYYHGLSNRTLWPLFHSLPERTRFEGRDFEAYEHVNALFAEAIHASARHAELVWIHDYHLLLAPASLRLADSKQRIAFFLHIPFPPYDVFRLLPWDREILRGLLACDLIGFHVPGYARNFLDCVERRLGAQVDHRTLRITYAGRTIQVGAFPIGIEFERYEELALKAAPRARSRPERVVLGVDRLDYTKGIPERIRAFERLLELHPRHRENVVLLQIAVPSRSQVAEYRELKSEIDELVGRVNGRFATAHWSPIRYLYRSFSQDRLCGLYRDADVALITPLRDGMNLVAKEYVACQVEEQGVLVLSRMTGAAETMRETLLVNPNDIEETAEAIHRALVMEAEQKRTRMVALRRRERRDDVHAWVRSFLAAAGRDAESLPLLDSDFEGWLGTYLSRYPLVLLLDYDGTLTPLVRHPDEAELPRRTRELLAACAERDDTDVGIVSGRSLENVRTMVQNESFIYAGNHGLEISGPGFGDFQHDDLVHYTRRTEELAAALEKATTVKGAWVESKGPTLTLHYRGVPEARRPTLVERARRVINEAGYQARDAHCALEARPPIGWDKGRAVLHLLRTRYGPTWSELVRVVYVGDDQTDEDAFDLLAGLATTFRVGPPDTPTAASLRLADVDAVAALLDWLSRRPPPVNPAG